MADLVREIRIEAGLPVTPPRENNLNMQSRVSDHTDQEVSSSKSTDGKFFKEFAIKKRAHFLPGQIVVAKNDIKLYLRKRY